MTCSKCGKVNNYKGYDEARRNPCAGCGKVHEEWSYQEDGERHYNNLLLKSNLTKSGIKKSICSYLSL
jgi:hypothetical protein